MNEANVIVESPRQAVKNVVSDDRAQIVWAKTVRIDYDKSLRELLVPRNLLSIVNNDDLYKIQPSKQGARHVKLVLADFGKIISPEKAELILPAQGISLAGVTETGEFVRRLKDEEELFLKNNLFSDYLIVALREYFNVANVFKLVPSIEGRGKIFSLGLTFKSFVDSHRTLFLGTMEI